MHPIREYYNTAADLLANQASMAGLTHHPGDTGTNREELLRDWINKHCPRRLSCILGGKVMGLGGGVSRQIDCLVTTDIVPQFALQSRSYSIIESLAMAISVKSTLNKEALCDALANLASIPQVSPQVIVEASAVKEQGFFERYSKRLPVLIIWAYDGINPETLLTHLNTWLAEHADTPVNRVPTAIIVHRKYAIRRSIEEMTLMDGRVVPPNMWKSSFTESYPGHSLCHLTVELANAASWLNRISIQFFHYANEALSD